MPSLLSVPPFRSVTSTTQLQLYSVLHRFISEFYLARSLVAVDAMVSNS